MHFDRELIKYAIRVYHRLKFIQSKQMSLIPNYYNFRFWPIRNDCEMHERSSAARNAAHQVASALQNHLLHI